LFNAPQPRARLYTDAAAYARAAAAIIAGPSHSGGAVTRLERALEDRHPGCRAVAAPMARVGIYLALKHLIRPGQKVVLSPYTISDVVNMVLCAGGVPEFVDTAPGSCNIDPALLSDRLAGTEDVGAVIVTHFYGLACDMAPIAAACRRHRIPLVEDAAQAFGAQLDGVPAGAIGDVGVLSFGLLKHVTGFVGGAVLAKDWGLAAAIRDELDGFADLPRGLLLEKMAKGAMYDLATTQIVFESSVYWLFRYAYLHDIAFFKNQLDTDRNPLAYSAFPDKYRARMSDMQARIIARQFAHLDDDIKERVARAALYDEGLRDLPGLTLPPLRSDGSHIYLYYTVLCDDRDRLARWMTRQRRDVQISHHRNCAGLACFSQYFRDCPNAERAAQGALYLPCYVGYRDDQVRANIAAIRSYRRGA
jgi:dTDP-4-amino-4,6-dideoxygalactose transaminase